jgi:hypothetical protein
MTMAKKVIRDVSEMKEFKALLRGEIKQFEQDKEKIIKERDDILIKLLTQIEELNNVYKEVEDRCTQKIEQINASIKLHEDMLMHIGDDLKAHVSRDVYDKIKNIDTVLTLIKSQVNSMFSLREKVSVPVIVKSTTQIVERAEKPNLKEAQKSIFVDIDEKKPEEYFRPNGKINNRIIADGVLKYLAQSGRPVTASDVIGFIEKVYPKVKDNWGDMRKGLYNLIQNHLRYEDTFELLGNGKYQYKEVPANV